MINKHNQEQGQALVLIAAAFVMLIGFAALAIDGGMVYSERRHAQNAADTGSMAGGGSAALIMENNHIFYSNFSCNSLSAAMTAAETAAVNIVAGNGYPAKDISVTVDCNENDGSASPDKYLDVTTTITRTTRTSLIHFVYKGEVYQVVDATTRVRPRQPLVFGNAIVALNPAGCSGQSNGQGFHGNTEVEVIGGGVFSNGCLRGDGGVSVDVTGGGIQYFHDGGMDDDQFNPDPTQLTDPNDRIPSSAFYVPPPNCGDPDANNVTASAIEGHTLSPGLYCISGNIKVNNNNDSFYGDGVTLYMLNGEFVINGGVVQISAPPQAPDPAPAIPGMVIMFAPGNNNKILLNGNSTSYFKGTILAPESDIDMLGNGDTDGYQCQLIGWNVEAGGTSNTYVFYDDASQYSKPTWIDLEK